MAFHEGTPMEFLHLIRSTADTVNGWTELWLIKPLFVAPAVTRERLIRRGDRLTPLHSRAR